MISYLISREWHERERDTRTSRSCPALLATASEWLAQRAPLLTKTQLLLLFLHQVLNTPPPRHSDKYPRSPNPITIHMQSQIFKHQELVRKGVFELIIEKEN
jgi:hypothetical protein